MKLWLDKNIPCPAGQNWRWAINSTQAEEALEKFGEFEVISVSDGFEDFLSNHPELKHITLRTKNAKLIEFCQWLMILEKNLEDEKLENFLGIIRLKMTELKLI